jgi:hypothetical protein
MSKARLSCGEGDHDPGQNGAGRGNFECGESDKEGATQNGKPHRHKAGVSVEYSVQGVRAPSSTASGTSDLD